MPEVLTGTEVPGRGLGAPLMGELDADRLAALFGVPAAVPGTLNVRQLVSDTRLRAALGLAYGDPISFAVVASPGGNAISS